MNDLTDAEKWELLHLQQMQLARISMLDFTLWTFPEYEVNWHHKLICDKLDEFIYSKTSHRLMIFAPPRNGKSEIVSRRLPAFLLGINPKNKVIACSYSADLASLMNRDVQRIIDDDKYRKIFPNTGLSGSHVRTTQNWLRNSDIFEIVNYGGVYKSSGVGGGITGSGCNCFVANTIISCYGKNKPINKIKVAELVASFNHSTNKVEYKKVIAIKTSLAKELISVRTAKREIKCTPEHRIFSSNSYKSAIQCTTGNSLIAIRSVFGMQFLRYCLYSTTFRCNEANKKKTIRSLLFKGLFRKSSRNKESQKMYYLRRKNRSKNKKILWNLPKTNKLSEIKSYSLPYLLKRISTKISSNSALFRRLCRFISFKKNEKIRQSKIYTRQTISSFISKNKAINYRARYFLRYLSSKRRVGCSSYRWGEIKQYIKQLNYIMPKLSYYTPQIENDSIQSIKNISCGEVEVYDIQVEENNNFFANGILVHNCLIIDDPIKNQEEADSETYREKIWDWYTTTAYTRLEKNGKVIVMLTRWHEDDLAGRLLNLAKTNSDADQWDVLTLPAIKEDDNNSYDKRAIGDALWPNKYSLEKLKAMKASAGERAWNALFQQRPSSSQGGIFKRQNWKFFSKFPDKFDQIVQSWDLAFKKKEDNDFVAGHVIGKLGANYYLLDRVHARMSFTESLAAVRQLSTKWPSARAKLVEAKANGDALVDMLKNEISGLILVEPHGGKVARAEAITPYHEAGNLFLPSPEIAPWASEVIEEHANFPNGKHDDDVDAFSQGVKYLGGDPRDRLKKLLGYS